MAIGTVDNVGLDHQIIVEKLGPIGVIGLNATHFGCCQENIVRLFLGKELIDSRLVAQVQVLARGKH